jgi:hypothetical protein
MTTLEQRRKSLSTQIASFGVAPKKPVKKAFTHTALAYKTIGSRPLPWIHKKKEEKKKSIRSPFIYEATKVKDGETPVKGKDYFTAQEVADIKQEILATIKSEMPGPVTPEIEINEEIVKKIISIMHTLPETDKLEVSKGIRNAQSFIYGGTKYKMEEMMHGGSSSTGSGVTVQTPTGLVDGINLTYGVTAQPKWVVADGTTFYENAGYTYAALTIVMVNPPTQYIRIVV